MRNKRSIFLRLSLDKRVRVVKEYILGNSEVSFSGLMDYFRCSSFPMYRVLEEAGFCLLPKSWHTGNKILRAYQEGHKTCSDIGEVVGVSKFLVWKYKNELGLPSGRRGRKRGYGGKIVNRNNLILSGNYSVGEIAEMDGVSKSAICSYINRNGFRKGYREARIKKGFNIWG